jgi:hypothetical protein
MTQMGYLRDGVRLAAVGDDLISLDIGAGAYGCLPGLAQAVGPWRPDGRIELLRPEATEALAAVGFLAPEARKAAVFKPLPPRPRHSAWRTEVVTIDRADRRRLASAGLWALPRYWLGSFRALASAAGRDRPNALSASTPDVARDARVFDQMLPFAPFQGQCLFRSFVLLAFLRAAGRDADWVFGVRTYPFEAHCWLQVGDMALDDAAERVCGFTPILVI